MSSVGIETLTNGYEALAARDDERLMSCLAEDIELHTLTGSYRGHDGIRRWLADMDEVWSRWGVAIHQLEEVGERVLIEATLSGHSSLNDITMSHRFWVVWEVRDGRAVSGVHCADRGQALRTAESSGRLASPRA
jgi:ketosteroid isomerase-like protein